MLALKDVHAGQDPEAESKRVIRDRDPRDGSCEEPDDDGSSGRLRDGYRRAKRRVLQRLASNELLERQLEAIRRVRS